MPETTVSRARALQSRCFDFAADVVLATRNMTRSPEAWIVRSQLIRSATSTAANYRSACRSGSRRAFVAKLSIALEEADETLFWLKFAVRLRLLPADQIQQLAREADELVRVLAASRRTARGR